MPRFHRILLCLVFAVAGSGCAVTLIDAAYMGDTNKVRQLLSEGADPNEVFFNGWTALMMAAAEGHRSAVSSLIEAGAEVDARNDGGRTALMFASGYGYDEIVEILIENGADVNAVPHEGVRWSSLTAASNNGHERTVVLLLEAGADTELVDARGRTALSYAREQGHTRIADLLARDGPDVAAGADG